ncbi:hypothetical protein HHI36_021480 [Cryptolaemus montrouzieri]|uniref:BTB domain-containing protein n=1 Tax=Cryptolaemus montrouzieri TaxID=559131 RepID=A0ABD2MXD2_9CUCU
MAFAPPQQFCVRWNSYQSNLQNAFPKLLTSEHFVDVTLACENEMLKCHKVVLSACSTYFEKLLLQNPCQHPIIFMKDMKFHEMQSLVDFMYKGEVNVTQDDLPSLLKSAEALQIRGLCGTDQLLSHQNFVKTQLAKATAAVAAASQATSSTTTSNDTQQTNCTKDSEPTVKSEKLEEVECTTNQSSSESDSSDALHIQEAEIVKRNQKLRNPSMKGKRKCWTPSLLRVMVLYIPVVTRRVKYFLLSPMYLVNMMVLQVQSPNVSEELMRNFEERQNA